MAEGRELAIKRGAGDAQDVQSVLDQKVLETPRTLEACKRLGLMIEDLRIRSYDSFHIPGDLKQKQQLRFEHFEKKRRERHSQVLAERAKVIAQDAKKGEIPGVQSAQFLSMLEGLFEKEAKRLEVDLKGQLRSHGALVRENEEQLKREDQLQDRLAIHEQRRAKSQQHFDRVGLEVKAKTDLRLEKSADLVAKQESEFDEKIGKFKKSMLAEEERLLRFRDAQGQEASDKAAVFKEKVEGIKRKAEQRQLDKRLDGEKKLQDLGRKIAEVDSNREREQQARMIRSEQQHLHIADVRDNKERMDRVGEHRRLEMREQGEAEVERIETLLALKDQLLEQRKARNLKAEASRNSRGLSLRRDCLPGPGQYEAPPSSLQEMPVVKIGNAKVPGMVDEAIKGTAANPAPGTYDFKVLANGDALSQANARGGKIGEGDRKSFLDEAQKLKEFVPAPGRYEAARSSLEAKAPKMARAKFDDPAFCNDKKSAKNFPAWARPATETPGPAGYSVDDYTRKEVMRRAQKSLPNLTRDMLRPGKLNVA